MAQKARSPAPVRMTTRISGSLLIWAQAWSTDWVEVGPEGTLETFTIITAAFPGLPEPPIVMAYVTLDGADTALVNLVLGLDLSDIGAAAAALQRQPRVPGAVRARAAGPDHRLRVRAGVR